jgi:hypothetical protein
MRYYRSIVCLSVLLVSLLSLGILGVGAPPCSAAEETLNNASVIELQSLNLGDAVIIEKIKTSKGDFDTSISGLKQLKAAKVSDAVIQAMIAAKAPAPVSAAPPAAGNPDDPATLHAAGVWILKDKKMTRLQSETPAGQTSGGGGAWAMGFGASAKTEVILSGSKSETQLSERKPVFYLYLGHMQQNAMLGDAAMEFANTQNPKEIVMAQFTVKTTKKHDERLLVTGSMNAYAGSTTGVEQKAVRVFESERVAEGIYKVVPKEDLADGEYAFCAAMSLGYGRFFTFGIQSK